MKKSNAEHHNHNDVGNFIVYYDGLPLIIDVGSGTYTLKTFSKQRYDIWSNRSDYHNIPTINKQTQPYGSQFRTTNVVYDRNKGYSRLSFDLAQAYPEEAGINHWNRTLQLNRNENVVITDEMDMDIANHIVQHMMTIYPSEIINPGKLLIHSGNKEGKLKDFVVRYDPKQMEVKVEKMKLDAPEDKLIIKNWGDSIYRINFEVISPKKQDKMVLKISKLPSN